MYVDPNYKTKKAFKEAVAASVKHTPYQPGGIFNTSPTREGRVFIEGPHFPEPHRWYAECQVKEGVIVSVK
jgi:hypothetical protein